MKIILTIAGVYLAIGILVMLGFVFFGDFNWAPEAIPTLISIVLFWPAWVAFILVMRNL